jgi:hypothetical protein
MTQLFTREGKASQAQATDDKGRPFRWEKVRCGRCGGAGGSDKWAHTGWTCFECDGRCFKPDPRKVVLYTQEQLDKLNATQAKRDATRARKAAEKAAVEAERRERDAKVLRAEYADLLGRMRGWEDSFLGQLIAQVEVQGRRLSERQVEAAEEKLAKLVADRDRRAQAEFELEFVREVPIRDDLGFVLFSFWVFREGPSSVVYKGNAPKAFDALPRERVGEGQDSYYRVVPGSKIRVVASIKDHAPNRRNGEPETWIQRPKAA